MAWREIPISPSIIAPLLYAGRWAIYKAASQRRARRNGFQQYCVYQPAGKNVSVARYHGAQFSEFNDCAVIATTPARYIPFIG